LLVFVVSEKIPLLGFGDRTTPALVLKLAIPTPSTSMHLLVSLQPFFETITAKLEV